MGDNDTIEQKCIFSNINESYLPFINTGSCQYRYLKLKFCKKGKQKLVYGVKTNIFIKKKKILISNSDVLGMNHETIKLNAGRLTCKNILCHNCWSFQLYEVQENGYNILKGMQRQ